MSNMLNADNFITSITLNLDRNKFKSTTDFTALLGEIMKIASVKSGNRLSNGVRRCV